MAQWEHRPCGTVHDVGSAPPDFCDYCRGLLIAVRPGAAGWLRVGTKPRAQIERRRRGWECESCGLVYKRKNHPGVCERCYRLRAYVPRWREVRVSVKTQRHSSPGVTPSIKEQVFKRDGHACVNCGESTLKLLTLDHIRPKSKGGKNTLDNLQVLCQRCNNRKADILPPPGLTYPPELALASS